MTSALELEINDGSTKDRQIWIDDKLEIVCTRARHLQKMNDGSTIVRGLWINDKCIGDSKIRQL